MYIFRHNSHYGFPSEYSVLPAEVQVCSNCDASTYADNQTICHASLYLLLMILSPKACSHLSCHTTGKIWTRILCSSCSPFLPTAREEESQEQPSKLSLAVAAWSQLFWFIDFLRPREKEGCWEQEFVLMFSGQGVLILNSCEDQYTLTTLCTPSLFSAVIWLQS